MARILWHTEIMKSISVPQKKRGRPATGEAERVGVRMHEDLLHALDAWALSHPENLGRSESIRKIVRERLIADGFLRSEFGKE